MKNGFISIEKVGLEMTDERIIEDLEKKVERLKSKNKRLKQDLGKIELLEKSCKQGNTIIGVMFMIIMLLLIFY